MDLRRVQQEAWDNKLAHGFNTTDVPADLKVVLLDRPDQPSVGGGEAPIIAVAPAIGNAIFRACGMRLRSMPLVPGGRVPASP